MAKEKILKNTAPVMEESAPLLTAGEVINFRDSWRIFKIILRVCGRL